MTCTQIITHYSNYIFKINGSLHEFWNYMLEIQFCEILIIFALASSRKVCFSQILYITHKVHKPQRQHWQTQTTENITYYAGQQRYQSNVQPHKTKQGLNVQVGCVSQEFGPDTGGTLREGDEYPNAPLACAQLGPQRANTVPTGRVGLLRQTADLEPKGVNAPEARQLSANGEWPLGLVT